MNTIGFFGATMAALAVAIVSLPSRAQGLTTLYSFAGSNGDGGIPVAGVVYKDHSLYGTTAAGGDGYGTVFSVNAVTGAESVLYIFSGNGDGNTPNAGVLYERGTIYGTTEFGGANDGGVVFALDPVSGAETVLHSFGAYNGDGATPLSSLIYHEGALYGTTFRGGSNGQGTVFKIDIRTGNESIIYSFYYQYGEFPSSSLIFADGALYGTTGSGGGVGYGTIFRLNPKSGAEKVLHSFSGNGADGAYPDAGLIYRNGELYGTTANGGAYGYTDIQYGAGTVFKLDLKTRRETILYNFTGEADGGQPSSGVVYHDGGLYGTTYLGGASGAGCMGYGCGTIFVVDPGARSETVLYSFTGAADGDAPDGGVIYDGGLFYGTTSGLNSFAYGTVFALTPFGGPVRGSRSAIPPTREARRND